MKLLKNNISEWPQFTDNEILEVTKILKSKKINYLYGKVGSKFEKKFSNYVNTKYSIAVSNGTVALELALRSLGVSKNDQVILTPRSYYASASSILRLDAIPVFADVDLNSQNITVDSIKKVFNKTKTKAIICVHLGGYPCEMKEITTFAKKNNIFVIEDCAQSHGAKINNKSVGSFGDVSAWSFCNDKIISTGGEGGMVTTNNKKIWRFIWEYKDQGKNYNKFIKKSNGISFRYLHDNIGSNYRLTEMQSAIGLSQLLNLNSNTKKRNLYAKIINKKIKDLKVVKIVNVKKGIINAFYRFYFFIDISYLKKNYSRIDILKYLKNKKIPCGVGSCPEIYKEEVFNINKKNKISLSNAKNLAKTSVTINIHHYMTKYEVNYIAFHLKYILLKYSK